MGVAGKPDGQVAVIERYNLMGAVTTDEQMYWARSYLLIPKRQEIVIRAYQSGGCRFVCWTFSDRVVTPAMWRGLEQAVCQQPRALAERTQGVVIDALTGDATWWNLR